MTDDETMRCRFRRSGRERPTHWPCDRDDIARLANSASAEQVAARLGVARRTVHRWRRYLEREA